MQNEFIHEIYTRAHKGIKKVLLIEHASVNSKTPETLVRLTAEERERVSVTLYVDGYDSMVSGPTDHSEG